MPPNPLPQLNLALYAEGERQPSEPPRTRAECAGIARPCDRTSCPHHLGRDDERAGRPHEGGRRANVRVRAGAESCALDVVDRDENPSYERVGQLLQIGGERVRQLELRALVKEYLALKLIEYLEPFRSKLPDGCELTIEWPRHSAGQSIYGVIEVLVTAEVGRIAMIADELKLERPGRKVLRDTVIRRRKQT